MILVTGGTGFVGREVVKKLLALGYRVRLLVRDPSRAIPFAGHAQVEVVRGDALRPDTLPAAMVGVQAVVHLIGIIAETSQVTFERGHVGATRHVLAAARQAGVTRWIQMSACGTRPQAQSRYHLTKWQAEELVRQSGLDWTIFRPSLIYGYDEQDRLLNLLKRVLSWPLNLLSLSSFPLLDGGRPLVQPVSVREVAHCFAHALAREESLGKTFDLVGPVAFSWREMVHKIALSLGKRTLYEDMPLRLFLRALLWFVVVLIPVLLSAGLIKNKLSTPFCEIGAGLWLVLLLTANRWRTILLFAVPGQPLLLLSEAWNSLGPRGLQFSEQLKMAREDNIGDPGPAAETFDYLPESFEQGLTNLELGN